MTRATFGPKIILMRTEEQRTMVQAWIARMPLYPDQPYRVTIDDPLPAKSRAMEAKYHAMIGEIAEVWEHFGRKWDAADLKRLLLDQFRRDTIKDPAFQQLWWSMGEAQMVPSIDGSGFVMLGVQSRKFPAKLAAGFIEWLYAFGAELKIEWSNEVKREPK